MFSLELRKSLVGFSTSEMTSTFLNASVGVTIEILYRSELWADLNLRKGFRDAFYIVLLTNSCNIYIFF